MPDHRSRKPYSGVLLERLPPPNSVSKDDWHRMIAERERALFEHYDINPKDDDCWERLIPELVGDHVPGFQLQQPLGRKADKRRPAVDAMILNHFLQARGSGKSWREVSMRLAAGRYGQGSVGMTAERIRQRGYELLSEENEESLRAAWFWGRFTR